MALVIETGSDSPNISRKRLRGEHLTRESVGGYAGFLNHFRPQRDIGPDDVGKLLWRRAFGLASGGVETLLHIARRKRLLQRLADAIDDRLRRARRHPDAEPPRHPGIGQ